MSLRGEAQRAGIRSVLETFGEDAQWFVFVGALRNAEKKWLMPPKTWLSVMNQFNIHFEGRLPA